MRCGIGVLLSFSRKHESEADYIDLLLAAQAGYDPPEAVHVWERMEQAGGTQPPEFLSTHPSHGTRIADLQSWMPEALGLYAKATPAPAAPGLPRRSTLRGRWKKSAGGIGRLKAARPILSCDENGSAEIDCGLRAG